MDKINKILFIITELLRRENRAMSIREIKTELEKEGIKNSQQTILKYLKLLEKRQEVQEVKKHGKKV